MRRRRRRPRHTMHEWEKCAILAPHRPAFQLWKQLCQAEEFSCHDFAIVSIAGHRVWQCSHCQQVAIRIADPRSVGAQAKEAR